MGNVGTTKNDYEYWFNKPSSYKVITAVTGTSIKTTDGVLTGIFVGSGAAITSFKLWDSATTGTGTVLIDTTAVAAGATNFTFPNIKFDNGLYLTTGSTGTLMATTVFYK